MDAIVQLPCPPLPYYLGAGYADYRIGDEHPNRRNLGLYDLIFVVKGMLHIGENGQEWALGTGESLILLPEGEHYATKACECETGFYWVHFDHGESAARMQEADPAPVSPASDGQAAGLPRPSWRPFDNPYSIRLPKHARLSDPRAATDLMKSLLDPSVEGYFWEEQRLFAELLILLADNKREDGDSSSNQLAEQAAAYLQRNFREELTNETLAQALHFHPNYVVRCMKRRFGRTPMDYLHRYRLERAKRLLITTGWPIARIAEETGFRYAPYFSACFKRSVGLSPLRYRKQYLT